MLIPSMDPSRSYANADNLSRSGTLEDNTATERANSKLLNRFYEPLHLLAVLNADRGPGEADLPSAPQSREFKLTLRRTLDDLAWLCDHKHGGETVSAIAAEDLPEGVQFWLVSKLEASFNHLQWVLGELSAAREDNDLNVKTVIQRITDRSVTLSKDKVKRYKRALKLALAKAKEVETNSESISARKWIARGELNVFVKYPTLLIVY